MHLAARPAAMLGLALGLHSLAVEISWARPREALRPELTHVPRLLSNRCRPLRGRRQVDAPPPIAPQAVPVPRLAAVEASAQRRYTALIAHPERSALSFPNFRSEAITLKPIFFADAPILHSVEQIDAEIAALPAEYPDFSTATRIFRFVSDNRFHAYPLSLDRSWFLSATLFFNSSGGMLCGDAADLVVKSATRFGLPARRWALTGHVVAEVQDGGKWKMYDADYGVFFVNRSGDIASVTELEADPDLIVNPLYRLPYVSHDDPYTAAYANVFATPDNFVYGNEPPALPAEPVEIAVPPRGRVVFPGRYAPAPVAYNGVPRRDWQDLKLVLPPGWSGEVNTFLVLHAILGNGRVTLDGEPFEIGSPELIAAIEADRSPEVSLHVVEARGQVEIVYLLNPIRFSLFFVTELIVEAPYYQLLEIVELGTPAADSDGDGIPDDGDADAIPGDSPCADGALLACDDNCTFVANPAQRDADGDRAGNACDGDIDQNGIVDPADQAIVGACAVAGPGGPGPPEDPQCVESDLDESGSVDEADVVRLATLVGAPPRPAEQVVSVSLPQGSRCGQGFALASVPVVLGCLGAKARQPRRRYSSSPHSRIFNSSVL